jgi:hypothetical protein
MKIPFSQSLVATLLWAALTPCLVTAGVAVPNDDFASATLISGSSGTTSGDTTGATQEPNEPEFLSDFGNGNSIWWRWTAPDSNRYVFDTIGSGRDTMLGIYQGTTLTDLEPVMEIDQGVDDSDESRGSFRAVAGTEYFIAVDMWNGEDPGTITLNWSLQPEPELTAPAMVYNLRRVFTAQGFDEDLSSEESVVFSPRTTSVVTGLVVRGRRDQTTYDSGREVGPVAVIEFFTEKVGRTVTKYYSLHIGSPEDSVFVSFPGIDTSLIRVGTRSSNVFETAAIGAESVGETVSEVEIEDLKGKASLSKILPSQQTPLWFARKLTSTNEDYFSFESSEGLAQGQPIQGNYQKESNTLTFNATETRALEGLVFFDDIVATVIARLEARGYQAAVPDVEEP